MQYNRDLEKIRRGCIRRKLDGWKVTEICKHVHISRMSFYRYWNKVGHMTVYRIVCKNGLNYNTITKPRKEEKIRAI